VIFEDSDKIFGILAFFVFDSKIVHYQCELNVFRVVSPQAMGVWCRAVAVGFESFFEELVYESSRLG
jgi:hypothetical protein